MFLQCQCGEEDCGIQFLRINDDSYKIVSNSTVDLLDWKERLRAFFTGKVVINVFDVILPQSSRESLIEIRQKLWEDFQIEPQWVDLQEKSIEPNLEVYAKIYGDTLKDRLLLKVGLLFSNIIHLETMFLRNGDQHLFETKVI